MRLIKTRCRDSNRRALELRPPRLYLLRRCRNRLEQASEFSGLTDGWEFER